MEEKHSDGGFWARLTGIAVALGIAYGVRALTEGTDSLSIALKIALGPVVLLAVSLMMDAKPNGGGTTIRGIAVLALAGITYAFKDYFVGGIPTEAWVVDSVFLAAAIAGELLVRRINKKRRESDASKSA